MVATTIILFEINGNRYYIRSFQLLLFFVAPFMNCTIYDDDLKQTDNVEFHRVAFYLSRVLSVPLSYVPSFYFFGFFPCFQYNILNKVAYKYSALIKAPCIQSASLRVQNKMKSTLMLSRTHNLAFIRT